MRAAHMRVVRLACHSCRIGCWLMELRLGHHGHGLQSGHGCLRRGHDRCHAAVRVHVRDRDHEIGFDLKYMTNIDFVPKFLLLATILFFSFISEW